MRFSMTALCAVLGVVFASAAPAIAQAQDATARPVVQPLPSAEVQRLNRALLDLARSPSSVAALLEAGDASLAVDDLDAAVGFYGRAAELRPDDARVKLGLARVYLRSGRPVEAIPLLEEAEGSGAAQRDVLSARALAFDLVGNQEAAQSAYTQAITLAPQDDEARRRLAISQAISGNASAFQETLAPLIEARDVAAFRARAFGLAILGEQERAEGIVNAVMPPDLSARINPYLAYMPRLTPAQQAAAANLGIFPRAADIGREDPRIARFAREGAAGDRLEPVGEPLGAPPDDPNAEAEPVSLAQTNEPQDAPPPTPSPEPSEETPPAEPEPQLAEAEIEEAPPPTRVEVPASVADAFADMGNADLPVEAPSGEAVDIASLDIPREAASEAEPEEPEHPRRIWVQLATGRDVDALGFDWRRFARRAPDLLEDFEPHVVPWGQANRLLAGPLPDSREARRLVNDLAGKGIETFTYTSPEGTEIQMLK